MPCYRPMPLHVHNPDRDILVPCGQCIGCKLQRSNNWAVRIMHEASMHQDNTCVLLTYDEKNLVYTDNNLPTLHKRDLQLFIKRLRKEVYRYEPDRKFLYYACGEYGEDNNRPHYHAALMGLDFGDKIYFGKSPAGNRLYKSRQLDRLWGLGLCGIMDLNIESAGYIARYCTKKITGGMAKQHYRDRVPEFALQSLRPAIGLRWLERYSNDIYTTDSLSLQRCRKTTIPRYYDKKYAELNPDRMELIKQSREIRADNRISKGLPNLKNREINKTAQIKRLRRDYENGNHA